ncbi:MAG: hypothetical protein KGN16_21245 [Burkholderiales bacterium]|nr:hypothetical protein [Burkholderiales bacterium]
MNDDDILQVQRVLRRRLFEGESAIRWRPGRELAAQLLLYLDDPQTCWRLTAEWLRELLDADRVDGGYGGYLGAGGTVRDYVALAEAQRESMRLPSVLGLRFDATDPGLRSVWNDVEAAAITNVTQERGMTAGMRGALTSLGTAAKLALPLSDGQRPIGLICADWHDAAPRWNPALCNELGGLARDALGPLFAAAAPWSPDTGRTALLATDAVPASGELSVLTPAELKVARLVATGMSYKEVARRLDRSLSTVDHQLRSIRDKLGARSTARLVHLLHALL